MSKLSQPNAATSSETASETDLEPVSGEPAAVAAGSSNNSGQSNPSDLSALELAQALAERLAIKPNDWHRLNRNRQVRAGEQLAAALVYLLKDQPEEALLRLQQATGWLDRTLQAPPCPTHGHRKQ